MKHKTILIFLALILSFSAHCGPARKGIISLTQPDGTVFNARLKGDEFFRLTTTLDGCAIVQDRDGWWCYALFDNEGNRSSSGCKVGKKAPSAILSESRMIPYEVLSASAGEKRRKFSFSDSGIWKDSGLLTTRNGGQSVKHGIVILAQFSDIRFKYEKQDFADLLTKDGYSRNGATGSAKEYFEQQLAGKVNFEFEVSDIVTLPEKREEYGANMPDGEDKDPTRMIIEACQAADEQIDFTLYDEDKDLFYTKGDKIIQFDRNRKFTGKEVRITYRNKDISSVPSGLHSPYAFIRAQQHNVIINYPDSAYWMDENLQINKKQRICFLHNTLLLYHNFLNFASTY